LSSKKNLRSSRDFPRIVGHDVTVCLDMESFQKMDIPAWLRQLFEEQHGGVK
jgi:hypothetical protein